MTRILPSASSWLARCRAPDRTDRLCWANPPQRLVHQCADSCSNAPTLVSDGAAAGPFSWPILANSHHFLLPLIFLAAFPASRLHLVVFPQIVRVLASNCVFLHRRCESVFTLGETHAAVSTRRERLHCRAQPNIKTGRSLPGFLASSRMRLKTARNSAVYMWSVLPSITS